MVPIRSRRRNAHGVWLSSFCLAVGCLVIPACSDDPVLPLPQDTQVESSWSIDSSHEVFGDIGASGQNAFTVGNTGTYKYDGVVWQRITTGAPRRIVVTASGKVYGVSYSEVWRLDDTVWDSMLEIKSLYARLPPYLSLTDVWADDSGEVFAVGSSYFVGGNAYRTAVYHFDGTTWKEIGPSGGIIYAVWGSSPNDVFMGGSGGDIFHFDGTGWTLVDTGTHYTIRGIWGRSGSDVFAVGDEGTIRWDYRTGKVRWYSAATQAEEVFPNPPAWESNDMYVAEMQHFLRCLAGKEDPTLDAFEGARVLELALAAKRSAERGNVVEITSSLSVFAGE